MTVTPSPRRSYRRDGSSSSMPTSTIIIIAVACGCVALLVLSLFLWRLIARSFKPKRSIPLPPVQELAHQREQQIALYSDARLAGSATWIDADGRPYSRNLLKPAGSATSLLSSTAKLPMFSADEMSTESSSRIPSPLSAEHLAAPNPLFNGISPHESVTSLASAVTENDTPVISPSSSMPTSEQSIMSTHSDTQSMTRPARLPSQSRSVSRTRSRPISLASSASTLQTMRSSPSRRSLLRGTPHSRHSTMQVVLPAPLAPEVYPYAQAAMPGEVIPGSRSSYMFGGMVSSESRRHVALADQWVPGSSPSPQRPNASTGSLGRRSSSLAGHSNLRESPSAWSMHSPSRRSQSQSSIADNSKSQQPPPPVPRIPSAYGLSTVPAGVRPSDPQQERGRSRHSSASVPPPAPILYPPSQSMTSEEFPDRASQPQPSKTHSDQDVPRARPPSKLRKQRQSSIKRP